MQSDSLSPGPFVDYCDGAKLLVEHLARSTAVETLAIVKFAGLRNGWAGKHASGRLNQLVTMTRTIFKWGWELDLVTMPVKLGPDFKGASKRQIREPCNALIEVSKPQMLIRSVSTSIKAL